MSTKTPIASEWDERMHDAGRAVLQKIVDTPVEEYPCLHMIVDDVFPQDIYAEIQRHWPSREAFHTLADRGRVSKGAKQPDYGARSSWVLSNDNLQQSRNTIQEQQRAFWTSFAAWLNSDEFTSTMLSKCAQYLMQRYGNDIYELYYETLL